MRLRDRPDVAQWGRAGRLFRWAHSWHNVALACNRAPQLAHRQYTRTPFGVTSRWIDVELEYISALQSSGISSGRGIRRSMRHARMRSMMR